jgi:predicted RNA binding protein YcfA (HicA-like mRNA interferase family)
MGQRKYPPLTPNEIIDILLARGFKFHKTRGDHRFYTHTVKGKKKIAQVDMGNPFVTDKWIKLVILQTGMTREEFYCSTKSSAKKINLKCALDDELKNWVMA